MQNAQQGPENPFKTVFNLFENINNTHDMSSIPFSGVMKCQYCASLMSFVMKGSDGNNFHGCQAARASDWQCY